MFPKWLDPAFERGGGRLSVEEFMRLALYDPDHGYYTAHIKTVGRHGDFSTTATMHRSLGKAVCNWVSSSNLIEVGGGDGSLAESILRSLSWWRRRKIRYHLVETSAPLIARQEDRLKRFGKTVKWHSDVRSALEACGGLADLFSNELVDAFPVIALRWDGSRRGWDEMFVGADGRIQLEPADFAVDWEPENGQRIEHHRSYRLWLEEWLPSWRSGKMLTIDYGDTFPELYWRRPAGTLRAYFAQQCFDQESEFFARAGHQDLTADVNFSDLIRWGDELELNGAKLVNQREFLIGQIPDIERMASGDPALAFLLDENGAGGAFKVLEQVRS